MDLRWAALATGFLVSMPFCAPVRAQPMERPALSEGDTWTYRLSEGGTPVSPGNNDFVEWFAVNRILPPRPDAGEGYQMFHVTTAERSGDKTKGIYRISRNLNSYARRNATDPLQEAGWLQWPLEPGRSWKFEAPVAGGINVWEARVKDWEDVEVSAGKFRAIRVVYDLVKAPNPLVTWELTRWYAPAVKAFVKQTDYGYYEASIAIRRDIRELQSFRLQ